MRLIISEKANAAKKIAQFLAEGKVKEGKHRAVPHHTFDWKGEETVSIGLKGHILNPEYPEEYSNWQKVEPSELIDAEILKPVSEKGVAAAIKSLAKKADSVIVATDYDREGELIGVEALSIVFEAKPELADSVKRSRFSALTKGEVTRAFDELVEVSHDLADAGEARQDIDLIWGATLTRWVSRATKRYGSAFLSVGRVQSPTLVLIAERELERRAFKPEPYWEIEATLKNGGDPFKVAHRHGRFKDEGEAQAALSNLKETARVVEVRQKAATRPAPAPFNTTSFLTAAASLGIGPSRAARIAEDLYTDGYISYPRTDNTVYPASLDLREVLTVLKGVEEVGETAGALLAKGELKPTRGKKETTDHPPIYPTGYVSKAALRDDQWKIYQLVVRRFLATLSEPSKSLRTTLNFDSGGEGLTTGGTVITEEGWLGVYPYSRRADEEIPNLGEGDVVNVVEKELLAKETQPPGRYGQGRLLNVMEDLGLGTKATRPNIIQNLYDRGYVHSDPIIPTEKGISVAQGLKEFAAEIASHEMTAKLERSMDDISEGKTDKRAVVDESRDLLREVYKHLDSAEEQFSDIVWRGIRSDETLGKCPESGHNLIVRRNRRSRKRFVGCEGYPDCTVTYPLPQKGSIIPTGTTCEECGSPEIKVLGGRRPWITCIDMDCPKKQEQMKAAEEARKAREGEEAAKDAGKANAENEAERPSEVSEVASDAAKSSNGNSGNGEEPREKLASSGTRAS
ncbi:DNA topoisomerase I [Rubrobacter radiotolerans]|uniref:DNA topoisomerase 1 n=1 Tax=Rubrobacter radiotolerans TaxID=42256 RepID=A0A023X4A7_RUBRA|nr:DNA topoisomerase I [Rubrobacter radiotolerans]AHY47026.1 DNA topoisomerase I [Rubrobacter radiotolerans]MDX5894432.1 DNA topoisomerase I [Rubrobacter radiotolerans]SMC05992.1 DNA topoisomerase-1 [Rubrobacter radiotolerans DSM 5868]